MHVFRAGKYRDFVEPFTRNDMSDESRQHISQWLNQLWGVYTSRIEALRGLPSGAINDFINHMHEQLHEVNGDSAQLALQAGLVDSVASHSDVQSALIEQFGAALLGDRSEERRVGKESRLQKGQEIAVKDRIDQLHKAITNEDLY